MNSFFHNISQSLLHIRNFGAILFIVLFSSSFSSAYAQLLFSDSIRVSLLTISEGEQVYERFGHTALRIKDLKKERQDIVFHYGVFNFNAPNFVCRFLKGETDYRLGALYYQGFKEDYQRRGLRMVEQELNLTSPQTQEVVNKLLINIRPENCVYRYSYLFDNCATRPFHLIDEATQHTISYDTIYGDGATLRDLLKEKTGENTWLDFGISLIVSRRADLTSSFNERMFLPEYLMKAYSDAKIAHSDTLIPEKEILVPWVKSQEIILQENPSVIKQIHSSPWISPNTAAWIFFGLTVLLSTCGFMFDLRLRVFDTILLCIIGLAGILVWFMSFFSVHPAMDQNINCLWLWPTHLLFAVLIWIKRCKKAIYFYFFINFAALIVYLLLSSFITQHIHTAFIPIVLALAIRSLTIIFQSKKDLKRIR